MHYKGTDKNISFLFFRGHKFQVLEPKVISHLRWEQAALPELVIKLHPLFQQWIFLLTQIWDLLANLFGILGAAASKETVPFTQLSLKRLDATCKCHQVFT